MRENSLHIIAQSQTFIIPANGDTSKHVNLERRGYKHSDKTPTGLYVNKDQTISVITESDGLKLSIGQWGPYDALNDGKDISFTSYNLNIGENTITFEKGIGMIYVINTSEEIDKTVTIEGANQAPVFRVNETTQQEWLDQMDLYTEAPFTEFIGKDIFATYQYNIATNTARDLDVNFIINHWDEVYRMQNEVHGLDENATGVAKKYNNSIHYSTQDYGVGYAHANDYRIAFINGPGSAAVEILKNSAKTPTGSWTVFHEVGHTYQNQLYKPSYAGEVTVNIPAYIINEKLGHDDRFNEYSQSRELIKNYMEKEGDKDFHTDTSIWMQLGFYIQFYKAFGDNFYPRLNQEYRILINPDFPDNEAKLQGLLLHSSLVTERNLTAFFAKWGIYANEAVTDKIKHLPDLTSPIWENIYDENIIIVERQLPKYIPPRATVKTGQYIIGQPLKEEDLSNFLLDLEVAVPPYDIEWIADDNIKKNTTLDVIITDADRNKNRFSLPIEFKYGNSLSFIGKEYVKEVFILTLKSDEKTFKMFFDKKDSTPIEGGTGFYTLMTIYEPTGEAKNSFTVNREDSNVDFATKVSGNSYENGQLLHIKMFTDRKLVAWKDSLEILAQDDATKNIFFKIENDQFNLLNPEDLKPQATAIPVRTDIGIAVTAEKMLRNVKVFFGTSPVIKFVNEPNFYIPGEVQTQVRVTDEAGNESVFTTTLTVKYNTAISLYAYASEERAVIRVDSVTKTLQAFSNPKIDTPISSRTGTGIFYEFVLYSVDLIEKKRVLARGEEKPFDFISAIHETEYDDEDYIHIFVAESGKIGAYVMNNQLFPRNESLKDEWFRVAFGELKRVDSPL